MGSLRSLHFYNALGFVAFVWTLSSFALVASERLVRSPALPNLARQRPCSCACAWLSDALIAHCTDHFRAFASSHIVTTQKNEPSHIHRMPSECSLVYNVPGSMQSFTSSKVDCLPKTKVGPFGSNFFAQNFLGQECLLRLSRGL